MTTRKALRSRVAGGGNYFAAPNRDIKFIPSGSKVLDMALGGGWAKGRVANIVGDKSTGKTLLCIEATANFIGLYPKGRARYREIEGAFSPSYANALGMPIDRVDFGSKRLRTVEDLYNDLTQITQQARSPEFVIVDSLDALSDAGELERDFGEGSFGTQKAKEMSKMFRMLDLIELNEHVTLIFVSQIREKINAMPYAKKWTRAGGKALDFYASHVVYLAHLGAVAQKIKQNDVSIERKTGIMIRAMVEKNKVGLPLREAQFNIHFGYGIDDALSCLEWIESVGSLKEVGIAENKIKAYARNLMRVTDNAEHAKAMQQLHEIVDRRWWEVEQTFLPARRKYGG